MIQQWTIIRASVVVVVVVVWRWRWRHMIDHSASSEVDSCSCKLVQPLVCKKNLPEGIILTGLTPRLLDGFDMLALSD
jgi:hypothetical protein